MSFELVKDYLRPHYLKRLYFPLYPDRRASYLTECWNKPHFPVTEKIRELITRRPGQADVLFLPMTDWHARIQRSQHLAMNFGALGARCFYLNPHLGREFPQPYSRTNDLRAGLVAPQTLEVHIHLPREPIYHHRMLTGRETARLLRGVERLVASAGADRLIQFVSFPLWSEVARQIKRAFGFPIVYDCHDLLDGFDAISQDILAAEPSLFESADLLCFTSEWLLDKALSERPWLAPKSAIVRNAVNPRDFAATAVPARTSAPTIGYAGSLDFWFDVEAIRLAATRRPEWNFVLIGRIESPKILELTALPNVSLTGEVPYAELPALMAAFDVGVIPFLKIPLTLATNPLKLYEYLSIGVPVVSTRLPEIEAFCDLVYLSDSAEEFADLLERAVAERDPELRSKRRAAAAANSWLARCQELNSQFESIYSRA